MINLATDSELTGRVTAADADNPYGSIKNETAPGANDGTQLIKRRSDNIFGFLYAAMVAASIVPDGDVETATSSQVLTALHTLYRGSVAVNLNNMQKIAAALNNDPNYNTTIRAYIDGQITTLTNLLRGTVAANLNTLQELAAAINNDSDFHGTIDQRFTDLVDGAPSDLNTLNELAAAINDDADFHNTITTAISTAISDLNLDVALAAVSNMTGNVRSLVDIVLAGASGAFWPFDYLVSNLPAGLVFNESERRVTGRPTTEESPNVTYRVTDNRSNSVSRSFSWTIGAALDSDTIWFLNNGAKLATAYTASTRARKSNFDISLGTENWFGAVSDGITLWFINDTNNIATAYTVATRARNSNFDISLGTGAWRGAVSDGITLWFINDADNLATAYTAATRTRNSNFDISLGAHSWQAGVSDGITLWFINDTDNLATAYTAATRTRNSNFDVSTSSNLEAAGSDGITLWFVNNAVGVATAYTAATRTRNSNFDISLGSGLWAGGVFA